MGLLDRLLGKDPSGGDIAPAATVDLPLYPGDESLEVVGESHRQDVLWRTVGGQSRNPIRRHCRAELVPEPTNEYDPNAVKVLIDSELVGYLSRDDAATYQPGLINLRSRTNGRVGLPGLIIGGGQRPDGLGLLGVWLDYNPSDFGVVVERTREPRGFRSGFSEAMETDLDDETYDLSWYTELSDDDSEAIGQLQSWLQTDPDPIDRHYMMCELEKRLYRNRKEASALADYDKVCRKHDAEMVSIRPALLEKFGKIPVIGMYRQAVIRFQRAKDWPMMVTWAERGISVYGGQAARPEVVEDLHKRLGYAIAKIDAANRPKPERRQRVPSAGETSGGPGEIEVLICGLCGNAFERVRTRGRKPHACPTCRGV